MQTVQSTKSLMIFELAYGGHYAFYIKHLLDQSTKQDRFDTIHVVVTQNFFDAHNEVIEWAASNCKIATFHKADELRNIFTRDKSYSSSELIKRYTNLLELWVQKLSPDSCLLTDFGPFQFSFALRKRFGTRTKFSGIHFSPMFHYRELFDQKLDTREMIRSLRQNWSLRLALRSPQLKTLFFLDQFAASYLAKYNKKSMFLPDPVEAQPENPIILKELEKELRIETGRTIFTLFGALTSRKGIFKTLDAILLLESEVSSKTAIVFSGVVIGAERENFLNKLAQVRSKSNCQIILLERFVTDEEAIQLFYLSDVILAPYVKHVGMSGILLRAAAAGKPIISSDFGLLGRLTSERKLGVVVDTQRPDTIADAIKRFTDNSTRNTSFDKKILDQLVQDHSVSKFAETIYRHV